MLGYIQCHQLRISTTRFDRYEQEALTETLAFFYHRLPTSRPRPSKKTVHPINPIHPSVSTIAGDTFSQLEITTKCMYTTASAESEAFGASFGLHVLSDPCFRHVKKIMSGKYGVHLARYTHKSSAIIHTSTKEDDSIRYLSLHDNTYLRYFRGHKRK